MVLMQAANDRIKARKGPATNLEMVQEKTWHNMAVEDIMIDLQASAETGLTAAQAAERLNIFGSNELFGESTLSWFQVLISNLLNPMNFILLVALIVSCTFNDWPDVVVLALVILTNTGVGFKQEYSSEKTIEALKKLSSPVAKIKRDGIVDIKPCPTVVPGKYCLLKSRRYCVRRGGINHSC